MGLLEERSKNFDKAIEFYRKTLEFDQNVLPPARRFAFISAQKKGIDAVVEELTDLRANSKNAKGEYDLLMASLTLANREDSKRIVKAKELFSRAVDENPKLLGAYLGLGAIDAQSGDNTAAISNYKKLLEKNPNHIPTQMLIAGAYERERNLNEAATAYEKILETAPRFGPAANNLAWLMAEELDGDLDRALKLAQVAKEELPRDGSVADTLGWIHYKRGSARAALPLLEEAIELEKEARGGANPEILYHLAVVT